MDEVKFSKELQYLNETTDELEILLRDYDIKKEEEEIAFDLHHSIDIKEENYVSEPKLHDETQTQIKKRSRGKRATRFQMLSILDFFQKNEHLQCMTVAFEDLEADWESLTLQVNAIGGSIKPAEGWRKTFTEWKSHVRLKLKKGETLSELDQRCADFMERKQSAISTPTAVQLSLPTEKENGTKIRNTTGRKRVTILKNEDGEKIKKVTSRNLHGEKRFRSRRASSKQMSDLLDFIQRNDILRLCTPSQNWETLARQVNRIHGATKTGEKWRKTFVEWKCHVRAKLRNGVVLSEQEKRCAQLAGFKTFMLGKSTKEELEIPDEQENGDKKATSRQMSSLLDFMQENDNIRFGIGIKDALTASWEALAQQVNAVGGCIKTSEEWKMLYTEWKSHVRLKLRNAKTLSNLEKRCIEIAGLELEKSPVRKQCLLKIRKEKTRRFKKANSDQMSTILDFIELNGDFCKDGGTGDKLKAGWETLTLQLNSMGGRTKTAEGWQEVYADWKSHVKMKLKKRKTLTKQDKRCAHLAGIPIPNVRKSTVPELSSLDEQKNIAKIKTRSRGARATPIQKSYILDYIQENANVNWESLAQQVNAVGRSIKTATGWKKTYIEWKSHVRLKIKKGETLAELDKRFVDLLDQQKKKERKNKATLEQMSSLLDFIQQNENIRLGKGSVDVLHEGWEALSRQVNAVGGITQSAEEWKRTYIEWKYHIRLKIQIGTTLSKLEERCANLAELNLVKPTVKLDKQKKMRKCLGKRASSVQMSSILDFMEQNEDFRFGKGTPEELRAGWEALTEQVNALGKSTKTVKEWKRLYIKWKCDIRMKINKKETLSERDQRCADLARLNKVVWSKSTVQELDVMDEQGSKNSEDIEKADQGCRATLHQKSMILDFLEEKIKKICLGQRSADDLQAAWEALALQVNAAGGASKTAEGWRKAFGQWKSHVREKLRGGETLSKHDKRFLDLAKLNGVAISKLNLAQHQNREKRSRGRKATVDQMASFLDYLEQHEDFRLSKGDVIDLKAGWEALTQQLNAIGGSTKTEEGWKKSYCEWKSNIRRKLKGGQRLSELDKRCAHLSQINTNLGNSTVCEVSFLDQQENDENVAESFHQRENQINSNQLSSLPDFFEKHEDFRLGSETASELKESWEALAQQVNAVGGSIDTTEVVQTKLKCGETLSELDKKCAHLAGINESENREEMEITSSKRTTLDQIEILLDFIEKNENVCLDEGTAFVLEAGWEALAEEVNAVGGSTKTAMEWKEAYTEWKFQVVEKLRKGEALSKQDERCAHLAGLYTDKREEIKKKFLNKKATSQQMSSLLDFIQQNDYFRGNRTDDDIIAGWEALAVQLNALDGSTKTVQGWKMLYCRWKSHIRMKLRDGRSLSRLDQRCVRVAGLNRDDCGKSRVRKLGFLVKRRKTGGNKKMTSDQLSSLLDFVQENESIRMGKGTMEDLQTSWDALTKQVNALAGATKTAKGWKEFYTNWNYHVRNKMKRGIVLSRLEKRYIHLKELNSVALSSTPELGFPDEEIINGFSRNRKATQEQMLSLLDFIQENDVLRFGRGTADDLKAAWEDVTQKLNSIGGPTKKVQGWRKLYTEWKCHIRAKIKRGVTLSKREQRCANLAGINTVSLSNSAVKEVGVSIKHKDRKVIKTRCRRKRATPNQMSSLLDFIQENDNLRFGRGTLDDLKASWVNLTQKLNAVVGGAAKDVEGWKKFYIEWKSHIRTKIKKGVTLSKEEKRCAYLAGINTVLLSNSTVKEVGVLIKHKDREVVKTRCRKKRATPNQMSSLLDFFQENDDLRFGRGTVDDLKASWENLTEKLNVIVGGAAKDVEGWKKLYSEWKSHIRKKIKKGVTLSKEEKRCAYLAGINTVSPSISTVKEVGVLIKHKDREGIKTRIRRKRATRNQMSSLLDFIQENDDFRFGRGTVDDLKASWENLTQKLNAIVGGATKNVEGWKKLYIEWKSHIRKKIKKGVALSQQEKRCAYLAGINTVSLSNSTVKELGVLIKQKEQEIIKPRIRSKKATPNQMSSLLDFIQENDDLRFGRGTADDLKAAWENLTQKLNAIVDGATKNVVGWRTLYTEFKYHIRTKIKKGVTLSKEEKRCAYLAGINAVSLSNSTAKEVGALIQHKNQEVIKTRFRRKRATPNQMSSLLDFIQGNDDLRFGTGTVDDLKASWENLTQKLNAIVGGANKNAEGWKKLYTEWKSHIRTKIKKGVTLSQQEKRYAYLAGINTVSLSNPTVKEVGVVIKQKEREIIKPRFRGKRTSTNQMSSLLDFIQENDDFRLGKGTADDLKKSWEDLSSQLNAVGEAIKTVKEWKKAYTEWKSHVRIKLRKGLSLSEQEMRCANLVLKLELSELDCSDKIKNRDVDEGPLGDLEESRGGPTYDKDMVYEIDQFDTATLERELFPNEKKRKLS